MLTELDDDALSRELGTAFRDATADLHYSGRRRPPRQPIAALPAVAAVAMIVVVGAVMTVSSQSSTSRPDHAPSAGDQSPPATDQPGAVDAAGSRTIKLAGLQIRYEAAPNGRVAAVKLVLGPLPDRSPHSIKVTLRVVENVPDDAQSVPVPNSEAQAWVGRDPTTGDNGLYLKAPIRKGGQLFLVSGPGWTTEELASLVKRGSPFR